MARCASKVVLSRPARAGLALAGLGLATLATEGGLALGAMIAARLTRPRLYLVTHALAGGSLLNGLLALTLAGRIVRAAWPGRAPRGLLRLLGLGGAGLVVYAFYLEPRWLDTPRVEVMLTNLPPGLD